MRGRLFNCFVEIDLDYLGADEFKLKDSNRFPSYTHLAKTREHCLGEKTVIGG